MMPSICCKAAARISLASCPLTSPKPRYPELEFPRLSRSSSPTDEDILDPLTARPLPSAIAQAVETINCKG
ncbi:hypothetical protein DPMN_001179 [Dreissena polymorpha]|uniref:Uncharacterized protein n=1 Tax=Dreissena polymorpha TaxID=45954 RepID=A0A9D4MKZ7_DREPO|nr:hypothetical protein DPMN_001179 [Dreissena polymorpha]